MIIIDDTYEIDLDIKNPIPITRTNQDVKELGKRKGDYTNTIKLPNNNIVKTALGFNDDPASGNFAQYNRSIKARYIEDGATLIDGLLKVTRADEEEIECLIIGKTLDWKQTIADKESSELDLGTFTLTDANVQATWTPGDDIVFPIIDWGQFLIKAGVNVNYYPSTNAIPRDIQLFDMYPAFHIPYLIEKILNEAGFTVDISSSLNNYYLFSTNKLRDKQVDADSIFKYGLYPAQSVTSYSGTTIIWNSATIANANFDITTGKFTFTKAVRSNFRIKLKLTFATSLAVTAYYKVRLIRERSSTFELLEEYFVYGYAGQTTVTWENDTNYFDFESSDKVFVSLLIADTYSPAVDVEPTSQFSNSVQMGYVEDDEMDLTYFMPDWTQLKLLQEIKKIFNLYFNTTGRTVEVLTRSEYLKSTIVDLTDLVDRSRKPWVEFTEYDKTVEFKYAVDSNDKKVVEGFADDSYDTGIKVNAETETLETGFAATVMGAAPHIGLDISIPRIYSDDLGDDLPPKNVDILPRIFYYEENETVNMNFNGSVVTTCPRFRFYNTEEDEGKSLLFNNKIGNGLRQRFYQGDLEIREDGRIMHFYVNLNEIDIANYDIRNTFRIDNMLYELKEIKQYQKGKSTEIELIPKKTQKTLPVQTMQGEAYLSEILTPKYSPAKSQKLFKYVTNQVFSKTVDSSNEIDETYSLILLDSSSVDLNKTIPPCYEGKEFTFYKESSANTVTLTALTGFTINGDATFEMENIQIVRMKLVDTDWKVLYSSLYKPHLLSTVITATSTLDEKYDIIQINGAVTLTLPDNPASNKLRYVTNIGSTKAVLDAFGSGTINGEATIDLEPDESAVLYFKGSNTWRLL